jgi:hypothetical protein
MPPTGDGRPTEAKDHKEDGGERQRKAPAAASIKAALLANYAEVQYHYVQFLAEHLTDCRKALGGDFDNLMILAVLGQRFLGAYHDLAPGEIPDDALVWMSALRIADVTGIPRESVRRKLGQLQARGWVENERSRGWRLAGGRNSTQARMDLAKLDERGIDRLARMIAVIQPFLPEPADRPVGG